METGLKITETTRFGAPVSCTGALKISLTFCYSLTCDCLGTLCHPFKNCLEMTAFKFLILRPAWNHM